MWGGLEEWALLSEQGDVGLGRSCALLASRNCGVLEEWGIS